jgi:hypothetical protein
MLLSVLTERIFCCILSVSCTGNPTVTIFASRWTGTRKQKNRLFVTWRYSACEKKIHPFKLSRSRVGLSDLFLFSISHAHKHSLARECGAPRRCGLILRSLFLPGIDTVTAFAWEPKGDRFALITTNDPNFGQQVPGSTVKTIVGFYALDARKGDFKALSALFSPL